MTGKSIYSNDNVLYIRIPKTGSTSIIHSLYLRMNEVVMDQYSFAFVRNPYDRFLSLCRMFKIDPERMCVEFDDLCARNEKVRYHAYPMKYYTYWRGECFPDFIGRYENFQQDFDKVCNSIGVPERKLPHLNKSISYTELTPKVIEFVNKRYQCDFDAFGYDVS